MYHFFICTANGTLRNGLAGKMSKRLLSSSPFVLCSKLTALASSMSSASSLFPSFSSLSSLLCFSSAIVWSTCAVGTDIDLKLGNWGGDLEGEGCSGEGDWGDVDSQLGRLGETWILRKSRVGGALEERWVLVFFDGENEQKEEKHHQSEFVEEKLAAVIVWSSNCEVSALGSRKCWGGGGPVGQRGGRRRRHGWMVTVYCPSWSPYTHTRLSWTLYTLPLDQHIHKLLGHHLMSEQKYMHPLHRYNIYIMF